jgi:ATP phosphoribosyltransferase
MNKLRIAIPKGRLQQPSLDLFAAAGFRIPTPPDLASRRLTFDAGEVEWILVKDADVPAYVEHGAATFGISGSDQLLEQQPHVYEPLELAFGRCTMCLIGGASALPLVDATAVASKYPSFTRNFLQSRGVLADVVALSGSVELAVILGVASHVVDLVETGATLRAHALERIETLADISPRLIVNRAAYRLDRRQVQNVIKRVEKTLEERI